MIVSIHSLCICVAIAHAIGWYVLCVDFAPLSVRTLRLVPWRLIHAVLRAPKTQEKASGVKFASASNLCGTCRSLEFALHHGSCLPGAMSQKGREIWRLPALDLEWVQMLVLLKLPCVRTVRHLWVTGKGCNVEFVRSLLVVCPSQRSVVFSVQAMFWFRRVFVPRRGCSWLLLCR